MKGRVGREGFEDREQMRRRLGRRRRRPMRSEFSRLHLKSNKTHKVRQTVQLLAHQTALSPPSGNLAIHKVEKESKGHESQRRPNISIIVRGTETVLHAADNGHETAEPYFHASLVLALQDGKYKGGEGTIQFSDQIGQM